MENRADAFLRMIRRAQRGRLKIYLGYGAGVGKTYQMLLEGHQLKREGVDVAIGLVETHGREDTAKLINGLEVIPRFRQDYRGIIVEEMDVDAVLARRPEVALIDELAHTNVPGSRNPKRYQDVQEILQAGIHVITTLNVQHLESLYDMVERTVHVKVRERIPDAVVADADQIVNVDLSPEDLRKRLIEGKIYPQDRIEVALNNFFTDPNLETLRELTLRELASQIDLRRREAAGDTETESVAPDQVLVCLSSRGPNSEMLLRYGSRLAGRLNRNWYAVYVQTPHEEPTAIDLQTQRMVSGTLTLAKELGAIVFTYKGEDVADTILNVAREYRVGHVVIGKPFPKPFWRRLLGERSVAEKLLTQANGLTLVVLDTLREEPPARPMPSIELPAEPTVPGQTAEIHISGLGPFLSVERIVIWDEPIDRDTVLRQLADHAAKTSAELDVEAVLNALLKREEECSTFLTEGIAVPHVRIEGLRAPVVALGIARRGVIGVPLTRPGQVVCLMLSPPEDPNVQLRLLAEASHIGQNHQLLRSVKSAATAGEILEAIRTWEESRSV